jgi:hypothetical protein
VVGIFWIIVGNCLFKLLVPFAATVTGRVYTLKLGISVFSQEECLGMINYEVKNRNYVVLSNFKNIYIV